MEINRREREGIVVLDLLGKLTGTVAGSGGLSDHVLSSLGGNGPQGVAGSKVLLDLSRCTGADSLGIGELISLHVSLSNRGGTLKILNLPDRIGDLLRATQLISMFDIFDDESAALASFAGG